MSKHTTNESIEKAGGEISSLEDGISEMSSSKVLERKNAARNGMVLRSHSRSLQLSPLKIRTSVGASNQAGVRSRRGRPRRGLMASSSAVIEVRTGAGETRYDGGMHVLGLLDEVGVAHQLTQILRVGGAMLDTMQAEMRDQREVMRVMQVESCDQRGVLQAMQDEMQDQRAERREQRKVLREMREELREQRVQQSVQRDAHNVLREDVVQLKAMLSSLNDGQAKVLETIAVLNSSREESQQLQEVALQVCERVGVLEGQVSTLQGVVADVRQADERFNDFCEGTAFIVTERVGEWLTLLEDIVQGLESRLGIEYKEFSHDTMRDCVAAEVDRRVEELSLKYTAGAEHMTERVDEMIAERFDYQMTQRSSGGMGTDLVDAEQAGISVLDAEDIQRVKGLPQFVCDQVAEVTAQVTSPDMINKIANVVKNKIKGEDGSNTSVKVRLESLTHELEFVSAELRSETEAVGQLWEEVLERCGALEGEFGQLRGEQLLCLESNVGELRGCLAVYAFRCLRLVFDPGILEGWFYTLALTMLGLCSTGGVWYLARVVNNSASTYRLGGLVQLRTSKDRCKDLGDLVVFTSSKVSVWTAVQS